MNSSDTRPLVIFGTKRSASLARYCLENDTSLKVAAFTVDAAFMRGREHEGLPLVAFEELESHYRPQDCRLLIPMGYQCVNAVRRERYEAGKARGYSFASYVSSRASVWPDLVIGDNVLIYEHAIVQPFCRIGSNCIIRSGVHLSHHCEVADHVFMAPAAATGGAVVIGEQAFIGVGAVLRDRIRIAPRSFLAAGAVVIADTEADRGYAGNPARRLAKTALQLCVD
jgi:sugar O-acyltransferase (sialic acid O-acetyltransferase NeuD family)